MNQEVTHYRAKFQSCSDSFATDSYPLPKDKMETHKKLGIIMVHFGEASRTIDCLESFIKAISFLKRHVPEIGISILVIDNSGNFSLEDHEHSLDFEVKVFRPGKNLGYAGACFEGSKILKDSSLLLFSNNDIILQEDSLFALLRSLEVFSDVGAIQPLVLVKGTSKVDSIGLTCNSIMYGFNYSNWPVKPLKIFRLENNLKVMEVFGIDGMLFVIKRSIWDAVDGWDPEFFMFNEDGLLSWKLRLRGYRNYVVLNSVVYHERGGSAKGYFLKKNPIFPSYYISRNKMLSVLYIHEGVRLIVYFLLCTLFEFAKNVWLSIRRRTPLHIYYYLNAILFVLRSHRHIISERAKIVRKIHPKVFLREHYILSIPKSVALLLKTRQVILD